MKPPPENLKRVIHRARTTELPPDPLTPQFTLDREWVEANVAGDIELILDAEVNGSRLLVFSNQLLLELLASRAQLFIDGTFK